MQDLDPALRDQLRVVLVSPRNPLNIGAAARALSNFGFLHLRLVNAYDVAYREAKSAVNASAVLEASEQFATVAEAVADCSLIVGTSAAGHRQLRHTVRPLPEAAVQIRAALPAGPVALLFGSEKFGLSIDDMSHCHFLARIPTRVEHESMNLGQAAAVCMYELSRPEPRVATMEKTPARAEQLALFDELLTEILAISGYVHERTAVSSQQKIRRLIRRLELHQDDGYVWLGILRQIIWKLRHP